MLRELTVENLALIDHLRLEFDQGLNILTGETGAGKSIIIDAVNLILGGRSSTELIRAGAESAQVEAIFELEENAALDEDLEEWGVPLGEDRLLVVNREVHRTGRGRCRVNGQTVPVFLLNKIGGYLMDIHGQHAHQSLLATARQREILDDFGGPALHAKAREVAALYERIQRIKNALSKVTLGEEEKNRKIEFLKFQIKEIEAARHQEGEEEELAAERELWPGGRSSGCLRVLSIVIRGTNPVRPGQALESRQLLEKLLPLTRGRSRWRCGSGAAEEVSRNPVIPGKIREPGATGGGGGAFDEIYKLKRKYGKSIPEILGLCRKGPRLEATEERKKG